MNVKLKSLRKALSILELFLRRENAMTLAEISFLTGLTKTNVYNILSAFIDFGYIEQQHKWGKYYLGSKYNQSVYTLRNWASVKKIVRPLLTNLSRKVQESIFFCYGESADNVFFQTFQDNEYIKPMIKVVIPDPNEVPTISFNRILHSSCFGKLFLAYMSEDGLQRYLNQKLEKITPKTIIDKKEIIKNLVLIKKQGIAYDNGELSIGMKGIAVVVKNYYDAQKISGIIATTAPVTRLTQKRISEIIPEFKACAADLSKVIGQIIKE